MNWSQLSKNVGVHVELQPLPYRVAEDGLLLPDRNDDWIVRIVSESSTDISNVQTGHAVTLNKDHIHHFTTNSVRSMGAARFGFLTLLVQLYIDPSRIRMSPATRPGERLPPPPAPVVKVVNIRYPEISGLQQVFDRKGYRLHWCGENNVAERQLEGWEIVVVNTQDQGLVTLKVQTRPYDLVLMKMAQ